MSFTDFGLSSKIVDVLTVQGYKEPTPIQSQAIPAVLSGQDLIACAQTGTGKTAAFTLPLIERLAAAIGRGESPQLSVLILTPTRELAMQVAESVRTYAAKLPIRSAVVFGGVNMQAQVDALARGVHILVATPGRLLDHVRQRTVQLGKVEVLVLDEADRMLDMGFIHDVRRLIACLPKKRQNLLFSATFSREIKMLAGELLTNPRLIEVARENSASELINQVVHPVERHRKRELLSHLIASGNWQQVLVFTRTKHGANRLAKQLEQDGIVSAAIHGNKSQGARTRALRDFKSGSVRVLVATDIAARGLDISHLPYVVNYDLPNVAEDYVHRIGRTGRAGCKGEALSLVSEDDHKLLFAIERLLNEKIRRVRMGSFDRATAMSAR